MLNSFSVLATICLFHVFLSFSGWILDLYILVLCISQMLYFCFISNSSGCHSSPFFIFLFRGDRLWLFTVFLQMFFIPQDYLVFFLNFFVTCSWFVLNSSNDFSTSLALSCLRSLVWLFCVAPFRISFLFVVLGYLLIYRRCGIS